MSLGRDSGQDSVQDSRKWNDDRDERAESLPSVGPDDLLDATQPQGRPGFGTRRRSAALGPCPQFTGAPGALEASSFRRRTSKTVAPSEPEGAANRIVTRPSGAVGRMSAGRGYRFSRNSPGRARSRDSVARRLPFARISKPRIRFHPSRSRRVRPRARPVWRGCTRTSRRDASAGPRAGRCPCGRRRIHGPPPAAVRRRPRDRACAPRGPRGHARRRRPAPWRAA